MPFWLSSRLRNTPGESLHTSPFHFKNDYPCNPDSTVDSRSSLPRDLAARWQAGSPGPEPRSRMRRGAGTCASASAAMCAQSGAPTSKNLRGRGTCAWERAVPAAFLTFTRVLISESVGRFIACNLHVVLFIMSLLFYKAMCAQSGAPTSKNLRERLQASVFDLCGRCLAVQRMSLFEASRSNSNAAG